MLDGYTAQSRASVDALPQSLHHDRITNTRAVAAKAVGKGEVEGTRHFRAIIAGPSIKAKTAR